MPLTGGTKSLEFCKRLLKLKIGFLCRIPTFCAKATFCAKPGRVIRSEVLRRYYLELKTGMTALRGGLEGIIAFCKRKVA